MAEERESFFPGVRKGIHLDTFAPMNTGAKQQRIAFTLGLADGQILGLPEWLTGAVQLVQSGKSKRDQSPVELDGVTMHLYSTVTADKEIYTLSGALLKGFTVQPTSKSAKPDGTVSDVELVFQCYVPWNEKTWAWAVKYYDSTCWAAFATTQAKLSFGAPEKPPTEAEKKKADQAARQGSLPLAGEAAAPAKPAEPEKPFVEEVEGGDTSFADLALRDFFRWKGDRWIKTDATHAIRQLDPHTQVVFSKATRVTRGAGGPTIATEVAQRAMDEAQAGKPRRDSKAAAANDDTMVQDQEPSPPAEDESQEVDQDSSMAEDDNLPDFAEHEEIQEDSSDDGYGVDLADDDDTGLQDDEDSGLQDDDDQDGGLQDDEPPVEAAGSAAPAKRASKKAASKRVAKKATGKKGGK